MRGFNFNQCRVGAAVSIAATAALVSLSPAHAQVGKPVISIDTKAVEMTVSIDDALRAFRALYDNLLAEGRHGSAAWRAETLTEQSDERAPVRIEQPRIYQRSYRLRSTVGDHYLSIVRTDTNYEGSAHPNSSVSAILWDEYVKKRTNIRQFFKEATDNGPTMTALAASIRAVLAMEKNVRGADVAHDPDKDSWLAAVKPQFLDLGPVTLAPSTETGKSSGLTFHFAPDVVGAEEEGSYTAFVPWILFRTFLSADGEAVFSGERPPKDAEEWGGHG
jgi:hypothetical protein